MIGRKEQLLRVWERCGEKLDILHSLVEEKTIISVASGSHFMVTKVPGDGGNEEFGSLTAGSGHMVHLRPHAAAMFLLYPLFLRYAFSLFSGGWGREKRLRENFLAYKWSLVHIIW